MIKNALLSVSDKTGIVDFAKGLANLGVTIYSTGGTLKAITDAGISNHVTSPFAFAYQSFM